MRLNIKSVSPISEETGRRNVEYAKSLGFPRMGKTDKPRLAIVGGGYSIRTRLDELRDFDGDVWAINGAYHYLKERGIDCWFFSVDPTPQVASFAAGADRAIIVMDCHPSLFDALSGAHVEAVELADLAHGPTTSTCAPSLALMRGYTEQVYYGCEGSFEGETTHAYGDYGLEMLLKVSCDGREFLTSADMVVQVEYLGSIIREAYRTCSERSGGLLSAYIRNPDIDILAAARNFHTKVVNEN
jgi:hypothetical protein